MTFDKEKALEQFKKENPAWASVSKTALTKRLAIRERREIRLKEKSNRYSEILKLRVEKQSMRKIAKKYGVSYQRIQQILQANG